MELKNSSKDRELAPEGNHLGMCVRILDLGTQDHPKWGPKRKLQAAFEIFDEEDSEGNPFVVYKNYTASLSQRARLTKDIQSWLNIKIGRDEVFELDTLLGKFCMLGVVHSDETEDGNQYANIDTITSVPKSVNTKGKKPTSELVSLYLDETFDEDVFNSLPDFVQEKIAESDEYKEVAKPKKSTKPEKKAPAKKGRK